MTKQREGEDEETEEAKKQKKQKSDEHKTEKAAKVKTRNIPIGCSDDSRNSIYLAVARARRPKLITSPIGVFVVARARRPKLITSPI